MMTLYRRSTLLRLGLVLAMLLFAGVACSLGGGDDNKNTDADSQPTVAATITPPLTRTPIPTFTPFSPFPTWTPAGGFQPPPAATQQVVLNPTFTPFPTWTPVIATSYPYDVRISYPANNSQIAGYQTIVGSASHPRFLQYALEWGPHPNGGNLWYPLIAPQRRTVINGALGAWNTLLSPDGAYQIRLHVWLNDGTETFAIVSGITVSNTTPTAVPSLTPTPRPNRSPVISPIPSQELDAGQSLDVNVTVTDPDGDPVNLFVASNSDAIAVPTVVSTSRIRVTGVTAGTTVITVTATDNRAGLISTAFIVTVRGQNHAPTISPLLAQAVGVGETKDIAIAAVDPDGDPITVTAQTSDAAILTASAPSTSAVRLTGVQVGSANVTITVSDGRGGQVNTAFQVDVGAVNKPPTVDPLPSQSLTVGETVDVLYIAVDPDGDTLSASASSDTESVAAASVIGSGVIRVVANAEGTATVTLSVTDSVNDPVLVTFSIKVTVGNQPPTVDAIGPQTMSVGEMRDVLYNAVDSDNDPLNAVVSSDNGSVVSASVAEPGKIGLVANGAGTATVALSIDDGANPAVSVSFTVSVAAINQPPVVDTLFPVTMNVGEARDVAYNAVDPENDPLTAVATSADTGIVAADVTAPGVIQLVANGQGVTSVTLSVSDGNSPAVTQVLSVEVTAVNAPPTLDPISPQVMNVGDTINVGYTASDPENDPLNAVVTSDNGGIVAASVIAPGTIQLIASGGGAATVTLSVNDGINPAVSVQFGVTVNSPNNPPTVDPIGPQVMNVGDTINVGYTASDPENNPLNAVVTSDNGGIVAASVIAPGTIQLVANSGGAATVTLSVSDGVNPAVSVQFGVTVNAPNSNPVIQPVVNQSVAASAKLSVPIAASDPDGDPITLMAVSDNPGVVTAVANGPAEVVVTGVVPGQANVTVDASDGRGGAASVVFVVTVTGVNNPPSIQPIADQTIPAGQSASIAILVSDPDGDPVVVTALSQNAGIVVASAIGTDTIVLDAVGAGVTNVDVTADDAKGGIVTVTFAVTVSSAPPSFDLMVYPVVPAIPPDMAASLAQLFQSGVTNFGNQAGAFAKVGDDSMDIPNFMMPFAEGGSYDLGSFGTLQSVIDAYRAVPVRPDGTTTSLNADSAAAGPNYGLDTLSGPAPAGPPCDAVPGGTMIGCEFMVTRPGIALIGFTAPNVVYMQPDQFRSLLQSLVAESMSTYGVIPVLATIPSGNGYSTEQLSPYNQVIVEVASQSGVAGIPLWNLWRAMQERGVTDPNGVAPQGAGNLTDAALSFGANVRNLTALQTLQAVRQAAGIP
ncbi:MAG: hypothetical protein JXQ72_01015 [Anaerolineae bacterium]|nr:hypothetical protein [Anaerolineae bacterium]